MTISCLLVCGCEKTGRGEELTNCVLMTCWARSHKRNNPESSRLPGYVGLGFMQIRVCFWLVKNLLTVHSSAAAYHLSGDICRHVACKEKGYSHSLRMSSGRALVMSVAMKPGAMQFARTPRGPISFAIDFTSPMSPAFEAA